MQPPHTHTKNASRRALKLLQARAAKAKEYLIRKCVVCGCVCGHYFDSHACVCVCSVVQRIPHICEVVSTTVRACVYVCCLNSDG